MGGECWWVAGDEEGLLVRRYKRCHTGVGARVDENEINVARPYKAMSRRSILGKKARDSQIIVYTGFFSASFFNLSTGFQPNAF